ncbi:MAG: flagellar biosynthetic protein FliR [Pseudomonadota bacterium]|nr:flagellar biosynthetic protein FliR [Pseudomonadota bacterium]
MNGFVVEGDPLAWLASFLLPLFRIAGFFMAVPVVASNLIPMRIRMGLAVATTVAIWPGLPEFDAELGFGALDWWRAAEQVVIGAALGFALQIAFQVVVLAAQTIAMMMGLGFASMNDPTHGVSVPILSQLYSMLFTLVFLAVNGHLVMLEVVGESFNRWPLGAVGMAQGLWWLVDAGGWMFAAALLMALPAVTALLIAHLAFGVMSRAAPAFNIFSLGFPVTLLFGLVLVWFGLYRLLPQFDQIAQVGIELMRQVFGG